MEKYSMHKAAKLGDFKTLKLLIELGWSVDTRDSEGRSPLHVAAQFGQRSVAELLIRNHCNIGIIDKFGMTPLLWAAKYGDIEVVKLLLERGALANGVDCRRRTDLSILGCPEVVQLIGGADVNASDHDGWTPLMLAARGGHEEVVALLIRGGADVNASDHEGWTPLMLAARGGHEEVVALLIRGGAQVNLRDEYNWTALHEASYNGQPEVVKLLLKEEGIDLDAKDILGYTPLHAACFYGHVEISKHLLKAGASMKGKNIKGQSALCLSISKENVEIVRLLVQHGAHFEDEEHSRMFQNTSLSFKERVLKDVELCSQSLWNKFHNQSLPALKRIKKFAIRLPRKLEEKLKLKDRQIHEMENYVRNDIQTNNFRNLERTCSSVLSVLCVQCLINNE